MNKVLERIAARRAALQLRIDAQRALLAHDLRPLRARLDGVDKGIAVGRFVARHPVILAGAFGALLLWRPGKALRWLEWGMGAWQLARLVGKKTN